MESIDFLKSSINNSTTRIIVYALIIGALYFVYKKYSEGFDNIPYHPTIDRMPEMGSLTNPVDTYIPGLVKTHPISFHNSNRRETFKNHSDPLVHGKPVSLGPYPDPYLEEKESFIVNPIYDTNANTLNNELPGLNMEIVKAPKVEGGIAGTPISRKNYIPDKDVGILNKERKNGK